MADKDKDSVLTVNSKIIKEGMVKRRNGRMHQWTNRYFILHDNRLSYKLKQDTQTVRGTFELVPGTIVTDIIEESQVKMNNRKLYSFWVVNPSGNDKGAVTDEKSYESDEDEDKDGEGKQQPISGAAGTTSPQPAANRNLQNIVRNKLDTQKRQKESAEEQVELHQAHDSSVAQGAMVAAVAVGGVVVGAMTMGIGLIPYFAVVGITAAATGGAVAFNRSRRPSNSRLIMAFETNKEAAEWKAAIEQRIRVVAESRRPMLPDSVDAKTISEILDLGTSMGTVWKRVGVYEGMCVLEHITFERRGDMAFKYHPMMDFQDKSPFYTYLMKLVMDPEYMKMCVNTQNRLTDGYSGAASGRATRVRKAQLSVCCSPVDTFLTLMNSEFCCWPSKGAFKVVREIDDHADIVAVEIVTDCTPYGGKSAQLRRKMCVSRFWQLDDDGVYLVTYSSVKDEAVAPSLTIDDVNKKDGSVITVTENCDVQFDAVVTIAPRNDVSNVEGDIPESMVTCICQVGLNKGNWQKGEVTAMMESFLTDNLLELRQCLWNNKFSIAREGHDTVCGPLLVHGDALASSPGAVERAESGEIFGDLATAGGKYGSPTHKASAAVRSPQPPSGGKTALGVTTVQPGMEDDATVGTEVVKKKKMGFLQRMKSSSSAHKTPAPSEPAPLARANSAMPGQLGNCPPGPMRKGMSVAPPPAAAANRSVSPLGALLSRGKSTTAVPTIKVPAGQPAPLAGYRSSSGDAEDSDCSAQLPTRENSGPIGAPSSPKAAKGPSGDARTISPPVKRRDKKTNAEASKLRNHISMTDYEIQRLQKSLKKRNTNLQALEAQHSLSEENQQAVLDYNSEIQALHTQIVRLTARQQAYKDEYLALTGEPFEPSKGTRGMMERWKGRSLAHKEKDRWDTAAAVYAQAQERAAATAATATATATAAGRPGTNTLKRTNSGKGGAAFAALEDRPPAPKPLHWETNRSGDDNASSAVKVTFAALLRYLAQSLDGQDAAGVTSETYQAVVANKSYRQRAGVDAALEETKWANLMLILVFTLAMVVVTAAANMLSV